MQNTGLAKVAVQFSVDTFVVNQSIVLRINTCLLAGRCVVKIATIDKPETVGRHNLTKKSYEKNNPGDSSFASIK